MKKVIFIILSIAFIGCSENDQVIKSDSEFLSPKLIGELHNEAMTHFKKEFTIESNLNELEKVKSVIEFNQNFLVAKYNEIGKDFISVISESENIALFDTEKLANSSFYSEPGNSSKTEEMNIYEKNAFLHNESAIDDQEYDILDRLAKLHQDNYEKKISDSELKDGVLELQNEFNSLSKNLNEIGSYYTAISIEIALSSNEWWEENYTEESRKASIYSKSKVAPWVAADVVGGIGSGFVNLIKQGIRNSQNGQSGQTADAGELAAAMIEGAIMSSVAPWSKIAKLF